MISVLHISDLHRDAGSALTTGSLLESLRLDRARYLDEGIRSPDICVVSGDIVYGVTTDDADSDRALKEQYEEAEDFLVKLADLFFGGNRERIVLVPGNHDVSHSHVLRATNPEDLPVEREKRALLARELASDGKPWRWLWPEFSLRRISDVDLYNKRMEPFADFYKAFYQGRRSYSLTPNEQYALHDFPSCCDNDLFNRSGRIHPDCVAGVTLAVAPYVQLGRIPIAVWHHNLAGGPRDSDYVDGEFLQSLMDGGFVIGLHGHQHRPQYLDHRFTADGKRSLAVISAGTLCGGPQSLPVGRMRAYNVIDIDHERRKGVVHVRDMKNNSFSLPVWGAAHVPEFSGSFMEFNLSIRPLADFGDYAAGDAMELLRHGDAESAFSLARQHPNNPWARRVAIEALEEMSDWNRLRVFCTPPQSNVEIIKLLEALYELGDKAELKKWVQSDLVVRCSDVAVQQCVERARNRLGGAH
jgi:hypothetical protein